MLRSLLILFVSLTLSGCLGISPKPVPDTYTFSQPSNIPHTPLRNRRQILIMEPSALKTLDSEQIVVRPSVSSVQYLANAQWNDRLPKLFQMTLASAFEDSAIVSGIGLPGEGLDIDYRIVSSIRAFEIIEHSPRYVTVSVFVKILNDKNGVVQANKVFTTNITIKGNYHIDYISSLDRASGIVIADIVKWVKSHIG